MTSAARGGAPAVPSDQECDAIYQRPEVSAAFTAWEVANDDTRFGFDRFTVATRNLIRAIRVAAVDGGSLAPAPSGPTDYEAEIDALEHAIYAMQTHTWVCDARVKAKYMHAMGVRVARLAVPGEGTKT